eukprot:TRINITY_DN2098_c0_g11_i1.p1 TRINITY_DN2098_c0_g11~~TRINITY_DN2098_c0_g11_i1.p1  ORF type:complete len:839 (-),score=262.28 TRINITY_DN2098_c0_g11_i1:105-2621(-)
MSSPRKSPRPPKTPSLTRPHSARAAVGRTSPQRSPRVTTTPSKFVPPKVAEALKSVPLLNLSALKKSPPPSPRVTPHTGTPPTTGTPKTGTPKQPNSTPRTPRYELLYSYRKQAAEPVTQPFMSPTKRKSENFVDIVTRLRKQEAIWKLEVRCFRDAERILQKRIHTALRQTGRPCATPRTPHFSTGISTTTAAATTTTAQPDDFCDDAPLSSGRLQVDERFEKPLTPFAELIAAETAMRSMLATRDEAMSELLTSLLGPQQQQQQQQQQQMANSPQHQLFHKRASVDFTATPIVTPNAAVSDYSADAVPSALAVPETASSAADADTIDELRRQLQQLRMEKELATSPAAASVPQLHRSEEARHRIKELKANLVSARMEVSNAERRISELLKLLAQADAEKTQLQQSASEAEQTYHGQVATLQQQLAQSADKLADAQQEAHQMSDDRSRLLRELKQANSERDMLLQQHSAAQSLLQVLQHKHNRLTTQLHTQEDAVQTAEQSAKDARAETAVVRQELVAARAELGQSQEQVSTLLSELKRAREHPQDRFLQMKLDQQEAQQEALQVQLQLSQQQREQLQTQLALQSQTNTQLSFAAEQARQQAQSAQLQLELITQQHQQKSASQSARQVEQLIRLRDSMRKQIAEAADTRASKLSQRHEDDVQCLQAEHDTVVMELTQQYSSQIRALEASLADRQNALNAELRLRDSLQLELQAAHSQLSLIRATPPMSPTSDASDQSLAMTPGSPVAMRDELERVRAELKRSQHEVGNSEKMRAKLMQRMLAAGEQASKEASELRRQVERQQRIINELQFLSSDGTMLPSVTEGAVAEPAQDETGGQ